MNPGAIPRRVGTSDEFAVARLAQTGGIARLADLAAQRDELLRKVGIQIGKSLCGETFRQCVEIARATTGRFNRTLMRAGFLRGVE